MRKNWTTREIGFLQSAYQDNLTSVVAERLRRSTHSVQVMANRLGLRKSPEFFKLNGYSERAKNHPKVKAGRERNLERVFDAAWGRCKYLHEIGASVGADDPIARSHRAIVIGNIMGANG